MDLAFPGILAVCLAAASPGEQPSSATPRPTVLADQVYAQRDGQALTADVYLPQGEGPFPAVLLLHGGGWSLGDKSQMASHGRMLASAGYVAVSAAYRRVPWAQFPAQYEDCCEAVRWMRREAGRFQIAADEIAAWGYSSGGHLACLLAVRGIPAAGPSTNETDPQTFRLRAVVAGGAICDLLWLQVNSRPLRYLISQFLGSEGVEDPEVVRCASPVEHVSTDDPPVWLYHGQFDRVVPIANARRMEERLKSQGVPVQFRECEGMGHIGAFHDAASRRLALSFLSQTLRRQPPHREASEAAP